MFLKFFFSKFNKILEKFQLFGLFHTFLWFLLLQVKSRLSKSFEKFKKIHENSLKSLWNLKKIDKKVKKILKWKVYDWVTLKLIPFLIKNDKKFTKKGLTTNSFEKKGLKKSGEKSFFRDIRKLEKKKSVKINESWKFERDKSSSTTNDEIFFHSIKKKKCGKCSKLKWAIHRKIIETKTARKTTTKLKFSSILFYNFNSNLINHKKIRR